MSGEVAPPARATGYYIGRLLVEPMDDFWCVREPWACVTSRGLRIDVTEGFLFDGFSIPRLFWSLCHPLDKRVFAGGCVHDFCFATHCVSRVDADEVLMEMVSCSDAQRRLIFDAVRAGGADAYATGPARQRDLKRKLAAMGLN